MRKIALLFMLTVPFVGIHCSDKKTENVKKESVKVRDKIPYDKLAEIVMGWPKEKSKVRKEFHLLMEFLHYEYISYGFDKKELTIHIKEMIHGRNITRHSVFRKLLNSSADTAVKTAVVCSGLLITLVIVIFILEYFPSCLLPLDDDPAIGLPTDPKLRRFEKHPTNKKHMRFVSGGFHKRASTLDFERASKELTKELAEEKLVEQDPSQEYNEEGQYEGEL